MKKKKQKTTTEHTHTGHIENENRTGIKVNLTKEEVNTLKRHARSKYDLPFGKLAGDILRKYINENIRE